jgi:hypothetical protein
MGDGVVLADFSLTSTIKILTNNWGSAASAKAAVEPVIPTETPQRRLQNPTVSPPQNNEYPIYQQCTRHVVRSL